MRGGNRGMMHVDSDNESDGEDVSLLRKVGNEGKEGKGNL